MRQKYVTFSYTTGDPTERQKANSMVRLEEYDNYYVYGKYRDGKLLYKECFQKVDIDNLPEFHTFVWFENKLQTVSMVAIEYMDEAGRKKQHRHFKTHW